MLAAAASVFWTLTTTGAVVVPRLVGAGPIRIRLRPAARSGRRRLLLRRLPFLAFASPAASITVPAATGTGVLLTPVDRRRGAALGCRWWHLLVAVDVEVERERAGWLPPVARHGQGRPS